MHARVKTLLAFTIVIGALIVIHYAGWSAPVERLVRDMVQPGSKALYQWSITLGEESFESPEALAQAYTDLQDQHRSLQVDQARLVLLEQDNKDLRTQLSFIETVTTTSVGATVVGRGIDPVTRSLIIDRGGESDVTVGDPVIAGPGVLIGQIASVEDTRAIVRMLDDKSSKVAATLLNKDRSLGLVEGGFGVSLEMTFIPQNEIVNIGDTIMTSGLTGNMPRGLVIGTVESVEKQPFQPFQRAVVAPLVSLEKLTFVSVLTNQ